jgi:large-conductance mechanosensitive channel
MLEAMKSTNSASLRSDAFRLVGILVALSAGANLLLLAAVVAPVIVVVFSGVDFSNYFLPLTQANAQVGHNTALGWGIALTLVLNFLIVAFVLGLAIRLVVRLKSTGSPSTELRLENFYNSLHQQQQAFGEDFEKTVSDNRWDLYAR